MTALLGQVVLVVSGVLVARALGVVDRGYLALLVLIPASLSYVGALGLPAAVTYFVSQQPGRAREIAASVLLPAVLQAVPLVLLHIVVLSIVLSAQTGDVILAGVATVTLVPVALAYQYGLALLQGLQRFRLYNLMGLLGPALYSTAVIALMLLDAGRIVPITVAWVASYVVVAASTLVVVIRELPHPEQTATIASRREMLRFGLKDLVASASPVHRFRLDQAVVGFVLSPAALGLYVVGLAFTNLLGLIAQGIGVVSYPRVAANPDARARRRMLWRYFSLAIVICGLAFVTLEAAAAWLVPTFYGAEFVEAVPLTRILLMAAFLLAARKVLMDLARGAGNPGHGTIAEVASWVSLLPALVVLTPSLGSAGVAWSMVLSGFVGFCVLLALVTAKQRS